MKTKMKLSQKNEVTKMAENNTPEITYQNEAYFLQIIALLQEIKEALSGSNEES